MTDEFKRLHRVFKSFIPRFPRGNERSYTLEDARMMINDLGMQMSPEVLDFLVSRDTVLDDFINSIYFLEREIGKRVITDFATIDTDFEPKVYVEDDLVGFSIRHKGKEMVFAEYKLEED